MRYVNTLTWWVTNKRCCYTKIVTKLQSGTVTNIKCTKSKVKKVEIQMRPYWALELVTEGLKWHSVVNNELFSHTILF